MQKPDFPALLAPGVHSLTLQEVHALAVAPFQADVQRHSLYQNLVTWAGAVRACGASGTLWLDGSFLTEKLGPGDIDCVLWSPHWLDPVSDTPANQNQINQLLNAARAKTLLGMDLYVEYPAPDELVHRQAYWKGFLGFCHDKVTAKGFAEIAI